MSNNTFRMTALIPSTLGMPAYGRAFGIALCATGIHASVVRDARVAGAVKGSTQGLVTAGFPGTSAWRPPIC